MKMYYKVHNEISYNVQIQFFLGNHVLKLLKSLKHSLQLGTAQRMKLYNTVNALKLGIW